MLDMASSSTYAASSRNFRETADADVLRDDASEIVRFRPPCSRSVRVQVAADAAGDDVEHRLY